MLSLIDSLEIRNLVHFFGTQKKTVTNFHCNCLIFSGATTNRTRDTRIFSLANSFLHNIDFYS